MCDAVQLQRPSNDLSLNGPQFPGRRQQDVKQSHLGGEVEQGDEVLDSSSPGSSERQQDRSIPAFLTNTELLPPDSHPRRWYENGYQTSRRRGGLETWFETRPSVRTQIQTAIAARHFKDLGLLVAHSPQGKTTPTHRRRGRSPIIPITTITRITVQTS